ncbi:hypothetical protein [Methylomonas sp. TEB]|uniref:hypothetical protein n=1 Tax=Methylomonas sp. TEB TaxID=3398229 RepID=UPI0039F5DB2A
MGGRSRESQKELVHSDYWAWVSELSNERLERYGQYTQIEMDQVYRQGRQYNRSPDALNHELTKEYRARFGTDPEWKSKGKDLRHGEDFLKSQKPKV